MNICGLLWVTDRRPFNDSLFVTVGLCESLWLAESCHFVSWELESS